ncbi:MAG: hypothetical protein DMG49_06155 [Acidobacteria bacterium]|nr:MAG: hypothetical protein DMG49_06155 [Acidobacteriota bacterium]
MRENGRRCQDVPETGSILRNLSAGLIRLAQPKHREALRQEISYARKRKKANRSLRTLAFFFVPIAAETLSVLKEAG